MIEAFFLFPQITYIDHKVSLVFVFVCLPLYAVVYRMNKYKLNTPEILASVLMLSF